MRNGRPVQKKPEKSNIWPGITVSCHRWDIKSQDAGIAQQLFPACESHPDTLRGTLVFQDGQDLLCDSKLLQGTFGTSVQSQQVTKPHRWSRFGELIRTHRIRKHFGSLVVDDSRDGSNMTSVLWYSERLSRCFRGGTTGVGDSGWLIGKVNSNLKPTPDGRWRSSAVFLSANYDKNIKCA